MRRTIVSNEPLLRYPISLEGRRCKYPLQLKMYIQTCFGRWLFELLTFSLKFAIVSIFFQTGRLCILIGERLQRSRMILKIL